MLLLCAAHPVNLASKGGQQVGIFPSHASGQQPDEVVVESHAEVVVDEAGCEERHQPPLLGLILQHCLLFFNPASAKLATDGRVTDGNDKSKATGVNRLQPACSLGGRAVTDHSWPV